MLNFCKLLAIVMALPESKANPTEDNFVTVEDVESSVNTDWVNKYDLRLKTDDEVFPPKNMIADKEPVDEIFDSENIIADKEPDAPVKLIGFESSPATSTVGETDMLQRITAHYYYVRDYTAACLNGLDPFWIYSSLLIIIVLLCIIAFRSEKVQVLMRNSAPAQNSKSAPVKGYGTLEDIKC